MDITKPCLINTLALSKEEIDPGPDTMGKHGRGNLTKLGFELETKKEQSRKEIKQNRKEVQQNRKEVEQGRKEMEQSRKKMGEKDKEIEEK